jgi:rare lipoprotein A
MLVTTAPWAFALLLVTSTPNAGESATTAADAPKPPPAAAPAAAAPASGGVETGLAAVYSHKLDGKKTASGAKYDPKQLTAAHRTLPFGTHVKVTHTTNHKSVVLRINDRGPTQAGRVLDISAAAAHKLGIRNTAMAEVTVEPMPK